ncbi:MAG: MBL fold metallo-hydrolase, partial [Desulfobacterales bacterium]|nr:MBL fold metallo-hydrolase [Desulfobacterales bacterium]
DIKAGENLSLYFLDVGQGDATILHQPDSCTVLIDAGPLIHGHRITEKLLELGVSSLDAVIITHPHLDHFAGLFDIAPRISIKQFFDNGSSNSSWEYFDDYQILKKRYSYDVLARGQTITCGSVRIDVLFPEAGKSMSNDLNAGSLVLLVSFQGFRLLHMGDVAGRAESDFLQLADDIGAQVIKVAHHGAADATADLLLEKAAPELAIISTASENRISSPSEVVLERLSQHGIPFYRTDEIGSIEISVSNEGYRVNTR